MLMLRAFKIVLLTFVVIALGTFLYVGSVQAAAPTPPPGCPGGPPGPPAPGTSCPVGGDPVTLGAQQGNGTCADMLATSVTEGDGTVNEKRPTVSSNGFVRWLCTQSNSNPNRNAIEVIIEVTANYILGMGTFIFVLIMALAFVQITTAGGSPEALKSGKKRLMLAVSSIAAIAIGRVILDLIGVTGGNFLGVPLDGFNKDTIPLIIKSIYDYLLFIGGSLGVGMIIFGGIKMMTSAGNPQAIQGARKIIIYAVIGLLGLASIGIIITLIQKIITG